MPNSANDATRRLRQMLPRCKECNQRFQISGPHQQAPMSNLCVACKGAKARIARLKQEAADFVLAHGQDAYDAQIAEKIKELY
jgi:hypothetical protein